MNSLTHSIVQQLLDNLSERQRKVIEYRYGLLDNEKMTLEQVAIKLYITRERARIEEAKALRKMRRMIYEQCLDQIQ